jgi:two-component system response regulator FixJ
MPCEGETVYVVDDDASVRAALARLVASLGVRVETCASAAAFLDVLDSGRPGCVVLDVRLGPTDGLDLQDALVARGAAMPVIVITAYGTTATAVRAMRAGALDVLEKPFNPRHLIERIREALERGRLERAQNAIRAMVSEGADVLSEREQEVLGLSLVGKTAKEIAAALNVSARTVEVHRAHILGKTGARSIADLVRQLLPPPAND